MLKKKRISLRFSLYSSASGGNDARTQCVGANPESGMRGEDEPASLVHIRLFDHADVIQAARQAEVYLVFLAAGEIVADAVHQDDPALLIETGLKAFGRERRPQVGEEGHPGLAYASVRMALDLRELDRRRAAVPLLDQSNAASIAFAGRELDGNVDRFFFPVPAEVVGEREFLDAASGGRRGRYGGGDDKQGIPRDA